MQIIQFIKYTQNSKFTFYGSSINCWLLRNFFLEHFLRNLAKRWLSKNVYDWPKSSSSARTLGRSLNSWFRFQFESFIFHPREAQHYFRPKCSNSETRELCSTFCSSQSFLLLSIKSKVIVVSSAKFLWLSELFSQARLNCPVFRDLWRLRIILPITIRLSSVPISSGGLQAPILPSPFK